MQQTCSKCGTRFYGAGCPECDYPPRPVDPNQRKRNRLWALVFMAVGLGIDVAALIRPPQGLPSWPALTAGFLFVLGGFGEFIGIRSRQAFLGGSLLCSGMASLGFFAAFGPGKLAGGIPLIPDAWNQALGRFLFGGGACVTTAFALWLLYLVVKPTKK